MTSLSRRHLLAGVASLPVAGALAAASLAASEPGADVPNPVDAWSALVDAALGAIEVAAAESRAAADRIDALRPAMPSALFRTLDDRRMGISGDALREGASVVTGRGGAPVMIVSAWGLQDAAERLADYPHLVARIKPRLAVVANYEDACARAIDESGLSAAEEAACWARVALEKLIERMFDEAAGLPGIACPLARGVAAYAALGAGERVAAGSRWGVRLAELLASPAAEPGPAAAPARMVA